jgi:RNA polymerase sigma factor (sigma-70 family)
MNSSEGVPVATCTATLPLTELSRLFGEHHRRVLTAAFRITGNMADAEDVAQAVFLRLASADGPVRNAGSYLYRAAINGALDSLRRRKSAQTEPLECAEYVTAAGSGSSPEAEASSRELGAFLRIAIGELPPRAAEMFILRYVEEHGNREIAALMSTSQAVVAVTLFNARSKLKRRLSEFERGKR